MNNKMYDDITDSDEELENEKINVKDEILFELLMELKELKEMHEQVYQQLKLIKLKHKQKLNIVIEYINKLNL